MGELLTGAGAAEGSSGRGRHKVFLGMAAGVGKTYRMLQEGHAEAAEGRDVVIGYLEPHRRAETSAQAEGLEVVPRRTVTYRETSLAEMDLPAVIARGPALALIDELAHTNTPGAENTKRYEDVEEVLATGVDVFSTVNVQHLESLNDQVAELTGTVVRETLPDSVLGAAEQVVLIDFTPEALIERLQAGRIYPDRNIEPALNNFFRIENLAALREMALRQVAETVEAKRLVVETAPAGRRASERVEDDVPQAVGERLLALVRPRASSQRLVRRAWRSAQRLGSDLDLLWVRPHGAELSDKKEKQVRALHRLASLLGTQLYIEESDNIVTAVADFTKRHGSTYIFVGESRQRRGPARLREPLPQRLMRATPAGVDVRIVAHRTHKGDASTIDEEDES
jgi:two-component system sensor histidine kinase KdpD